jgi:hypothetical protein
MSWRKASLVWKGFEMDKLKSKIEDIIIDELFETVLSASAAIIAVKLAKKIVELPELQSAKAA